MKFRVIWNFGSGEEAINRLNLAAILPSWMWDRNDFSYLIYKSLPSFQSIGFSIQEKQWKIHCQDGSHSGHLWSPIKTISAIFMHISPRCFLLSFKSIGLSFQEEKGQFQDGRHSDHLGFPICHFIFVLTTSDPMLLTKFRVNSALGSGEQTKNSFAKWMPWRPCWISNRNHFTYFLSTSHPNASYPVSGFFVSEESEKIHFQEPSWISDRKDFCYFLPTSNPDTSHEFKVNWPFGSGKAKIHF